MSHQTTTRTLKNDPANESSVIQGSVPIRRLSDADVRAIFESLHHGVAPPSHLYFQIVPVGPTGLKLSPPAHEFEGKTVRSNIVCNSSFYVLLQAANISLH